MSGWADRPSARAALLLGIALAAPPAGSGAAVVESAQEAVLIPGGVTDAPGTVGCLVTPEGGVRTVDLATGRTLWRSEAPSRALLIAGERTFVIEERAGPALRLVVHSALTGRLVRAYDLAALELPGWVSLGGAAEGGRRWARFEVRARLAGDVLEILYDATRRQVAGFAVPDVVDRVRGLARIELDSGRVEPGHGAGPPPEPLSEPVDPPPGVRLASPHVRPRDATLVLGGPPPNVKGALIAGDRRLFFELSPDARDVTMHRRSASGAAHEPPLRLQHGEATDAVWVTLDRGHVLLRRADDQRRYDLYSLESGARLGTLERPADAAVLGTRIYWTAPGAGGRLVLTATEAGSGRTLWSRTVRDPDPPPGEPIP